MKKQILILLFGLISLTVSAQTTLTQAQKDTLLSSSVFRQYLANSITNQAEYLLGSNSFDQTTAMAYSYSKLIRSNQNLVIGDSNLINFILIQMKIRGSDKCNAGSGSVVPRVQAYLDASGTPQIGYLVADYFADKTKGY